MKAILPILAITLMLCNCGSSRGGHVEAEDPSAANPMISVGMTRDQVIRAWGKPSGRQVSGQGEIWTWGGQRWKRMIPYAGPFLNVQTSKVIFGRDGLVKDFRLTDRGDMMTDIEGMSPGHLPW
jgi:hypothetical protein